MTIDIHKDSTIKIEYLPVIHKIGFDIEEVGCVSAYEIPEADFTPSNVDCIFVSSAGDDSTGTGDSATPYKTIAKGIDETTATRQVVIYDDSGDINEDLTSCDFTYFNGLYVTEGNTATLSTRQLGFAPSDSNSIYVSKDGDDGDAGTAAAPKLTIAGAYAALSGAKTHIVIADSGTYEEPGIELDGSTCVGLYGIPNQTPKYIPTDWEGGTDYTAAAKMYDDIIIPISTALSYVLPIDNGRFLILKKTDQGGGTYNLEADIYSLPGDVLYTSTLVTSGAGLSANSARAALLDDGNIYVVYMSYDGSGNYKLYGIVINQILAVITAKHEIGSAYSGNCDLVKLSNNNVAIVWTSGTGPSSLSMAIRTEEGAAVVAATVVTSDTSYVYLIEEYNNVIAETIDNNIVITCVRLKAGNYYPIYLLIDGSDLSVLTTETATSTAGGSSIQFISVAVCKNGNIIFAWQNSTKIKGWIIDKDESEIMAEADFIDGGSYPNIIAFDNGDAGLIYKNTSPASGKIKYMTSAGVEISIATFTNNDFVSYSPLLKNGILYYIFTDLTLAEIHILQWTPYVYSGLIGTGAAEIIGVDLDGDYRYLLSKMVDTDSAVEIGFTTIQKTTAPSSTATALAIYSTAALDVYNVDIKDNSAGIYNQEDDASILSSIIHYNNDGNAIEIDGTGAVIQYNTIFNNYRGIYLNNNDGTETLSGNILHDNDNASYSQHDDLTQTYSVCTDTLDEIINGTKVILYNPLFINEGAYDRDDEDLHIMTRVLGYQIDSPALELLASGRNAGAYNTVYVGQETTYSCVTIPKPRKITPVLAAVSPVWTRRRDGSVSSSMDGATLTVALEWDLLEKDYWQGNFDYVADVEKIWMCGDPDVRIYWNPTTAPTEYETYKLKYDEFSDSVNFYPLSRSGAQNVRLVVGRGYERA